MTRIPGTLFSALAALAALALAAPVMLSPGKAEAHPLGNFTINHFTRIEASETGIELFRVLEMAEIPTFREYQDMDTSGDGAVDGAEAEVWSSAKSADLRDGMSLTIAGDEVALTETTHELTFLPGEASLQLLRFIVTYRGAIPSDWRDGAPSVEFEDSNYGDRIGWREVVVRGAPGVDIVGSDAPAQSISNELLGYPSDYSGSPPDIRSATFSFQPGAGSAPEPAPDPKEQHAVEGNPDGYLARFSDLIAEKELSFGVVVVALLGAMVFGAIHALSPGHGKTVVAGYLVGSRGTARHALLLGLTVTATHTSSVYAIGFVALHLSEYIVPEDLYPWMEIASGALIVGMGAWLLVARLTASGCLRDLRRWLRSRAPLLTTARASEMLLASEGGAAMIWPRHNHGETWHLLDPLDGEQADHHHHEGGHHEHDEHDHDGDHDHAEAEPHKHGWGPAHSHAIPGAGGEPVSVRQLIGLGIFGGILPCPSAIVVMLSAISLHRVGFGLLLIVAFSIGLAAVLTGIGFALVYARAIGQRIPFLQRLSERASHSGGLAGVAVRIFPIVAAAFVAAAGVVVLLRGVVRL